MKNLAGRPTEETNKQVAIELTEADVPRVEVDPGRAEVQATIGGKLGPLTFHRAWYYWVVKGDVPIEMAKELHADKEGARSVRVAGHCGCPPPEAPWTDWVAPDGRAIIGPRSDKEYAFIQEHWPDGSYWKTADDRRPEDVEGARLVVRSYHIDTQAGLNLFAAAARRYLL